MPYEVDPQFRQTGVGARKRRLRRRLRLVSLANAGVAAMAGVSMWLMRDRPATFSEDFALVQVEAAAEGAMAPAENAFVHLRRAPMILTLERSAAETTRQIAAPSSFVPERIGQGGVTVLEDALFLAERRLVTTLPSSREDFALFQAQRTEALAQGGPRLPAGPVARGDLVAVAQDSSWGAALGEDSSAPAVYVQTRIENTTSTGVTLRESQRVPLFEDEIVVLRTERTLSDVLSGVGLEAREASFAARAASRVLGSDRLESGSIVALRLRDETARDRLMHLSIYGPDGFLAALAQVGAGRFEQGTDLWIEADLLARAGAEQRDASVRGDVRLLDALYSAGIRNGLATSLVGELIVAMSQRFDLERFVAEGDRLILLQAVEPGPEARGLGQILFVGLDGPSGRMPCYVIRAATDAPFACYDFDAPATTSLGGGLLLPVNGVKTSGFGPRHHPILRQVRDHNGVDWAAPVGTPVRAAAAGEITRRADAGGYGNVVYIAHPDGTETRYAHLDSFAKGLKQGDTVAAGDVIGTVGTTGRSTGPHLHFELRVAGRPVNPLSYAGLATGGGAVTALVNRIIEVESAGNARARNPRSTATGLGQFIDSTWLRMMRDYRPDLVRAMSRRELLDLRTDPTLSREMVRQLARENEAFLERRGHQITPGRLYLAHFLGPAGAHKALTASRNATVRAVMGAAVVDANPFLRGKSIGDLLAWSDAKMRRVGAPRAMPKTRTIPPEIQRYREQVDAILASL